VLGDTPSLVASALLDLLGVTFFMDLIFDIPQLRHFIRRAERLEPFDQATMSFNDDAIHISVGLFELQIRCDRPD
jgi:hypothetical protein